MKTLAIDFGEKRIGLAISDELGISSVPLKTIKVKSDKESIKEIIYIFNQEKAGRILMGIPLNSDGSIGKIGNRIKSFGKMIELKINIKIIYWDEYFSSKTAENKKSKDIDSAAAKIILQEFLNSNGN